MPLNKRQTLNQLSQPSKCRTIENRDIVVTPSFAGGEAIVFFIRHLSVFVEGEAGMDAQRETLGLIRTACCSCILLGREKNATGLLPLSMVLSLETGLSDPADQH